MIVSIYLECKKKKKKKKSIKIVLSTDGSIIWTLQKKI